MRVLNEEFAFRENPAVAVARDAWSRETVEARYTLLRVRQKVLLGHSEKKMALEFRPERQGLAFDGKNVRPEMKQGDGPSSIRQPHAASFQLGDKISGRQ